MTIDKGLAEDVADRIGQYVGLKGETTRHNIGQRLV